MNAVSKAHNSDEDNDSGTGYETSVDDEYRYFSLKPIVSYFHRPIPNEVEIKHKQIIHLKYKQS
jgi:hypothetical protein